MDGAVDVRRRKHPDSSNTEEAAAPSPTNGALGASFQKKLEVGRLKEKIHHARSDFLLDLNRNVDEFVQDVLNQVEQTVSPPSDMSWPSPVKQKDGALPDKVFICRNSVLTDLFEIDHIRTIYNIFSAILIVFAMNTLLHDLMEYGRIDLQFELIRWAFGHFPIVMSTWVCMKLSTGIILYPAFCRWATQREGWFARAFPRIYDLSWAFAYVAFQLCFLIMPLRVISIYHLPVASTLAITMEQARLVMKIHAFVRENAAKVLHFKPKSGGREAKDLPLPEFSHYLYFLFAPTLVYRDSYPRSPVCRWEYVFSNLAQVVACLLYTYYIFIRFCVPVFKNFSEDHVSLKRIVLSVFSCMLPGTLALFVGFFAILHSWLNAFAEMLRFGDRLFYKDWWNSTSFANYYRTWNVVVHDWLYTYVYKDIYWLLGREQRPIAMFTVFLISAIFHEYILSVSFGFCYPVLFIMFAGGGFSFIFLTNKRKRRTWNIFMWVSLFTGNGILMTLYSMEWYARVECPPFSDSVLDFFVPRSWICRILPEALP